MFSFLHFQGCLSLKQPLRAQTLGKAEKSGSLAFATSSVNTFTSQVELHNHHSSKHARTQCRYALVTLHQSDAVGFDDRTGKLTQNLYLSSRTMDQPPFPESPYPDPELSQMQSSSWLAHSSRPGPNIGEYGDGHSIYESSQRQGLNSRIEPSFGIASEPFDAFSEEHGDEEGSEESDFLGDIGSGLAHPQLRSFEGIANRCIGKTSCQTLTPIIESSVLLWPDSKMAFSS